MKRLLPAFAALFIYAFSFAQPYGNEWIDHAAQKYLKIKVTRDGIHRVDSATLSNALGSVGASLASINPQNFQVFWRGQEQYIYIEGESDGVFNGGDYLEFFGRRNNGEPDSSLYGGSSNQPNPFVSLFNDTAVYFLTWNSLTNNRRLVQENDTNHSAYTPADYFTVEERWVNVVQYLAGETDGLDMTDPDYISTEGWFDAAFGFGGSRTVGVSTRNAYTSGPTANIRMKIASLSNDFNMLNENTVRIQFLSTQLDTTYDGYLTGRYSFDVPPGSLTNGNTDFTVSSINASGSVNSGLTAIAWITINYPHTFNLEGRYAFAGRLPDAQSQSKSLLDISNIITAGYPMRVYDLSNNKRIDAYSPTPGVYKALVPNSGGEKNIYITSDYDLVNVTSLQAVNGTGSFVDYLAMPHDSAFLLVTHPSLMPVANDYKNYRASFAGGSRDVVLANVYDLYDQFGYGIAKHPLSIRRFADHIYDNSGIPPQQLFLLGKSLSPDVSKYNVSNYNANLVPTYGYPPADNLLTAGLNGTQWECAVPTGRLAARDTVQARWYLDKVIAYESQPAAEWMKHVLHFGGGTDANQQLQFKTYLNNYKTKIENDTCFGGIVQSYFKTSTAPIQIIQSDSLRDRIEDGVTLMTFFGHASGTGFDQSIDDPSTYNNLNRYPFLVANSCFAGDIHTNGISSSELFVLLQNKGVIGYLASTGIGLAGYLNEYTKRFYDQLAQLNYGKPVGRQMQQAVLSYQQLNSGLSAKITALQMTLHGDPAVIINSQKQPDYQVTNSSVWFDQSQVDSITVFAEVTNLGKAVRDTFIVQMIRRFPNGDTTGYLLQVPAPLFRDTFSFRIPVDQQQGIGLNRIKVTVDLYGQIAELSEMNNTTLPEVDLLIEGSNIVPVWPYQYAVIPYDTVTLHGSTANPFEPARNYRFEIDTTDLFNSPFKQTGIVNAPGGVVRWKPPLTFTDSTVYFWRLSPDSTSPASGFIWRESSFQYITGKRGWGQAHFFQFKNDDYQFVSYNRPQRQFDFVNDIKSLDVKNGIYSFGAQWNEVWYKLNGATQHIFSCTPAFGRDGVSIAVFDPVSGVPWNTTNLQPPGLANCVPGQELYAFDFFDDDTLNRGYIRDFLNSIPPGHKVLVYSQDIHDAPLYDANLINAFQKIGSAQIGSIADTTAFIIFGTKTAAPSPGAANEVIAPNRTALIMLSDTIVTNWNTGYVRSELIGPAGAWGSFHWRQHPFELPDHDSVRVVITGIDANGNATDLISYPEDSTDVLNLGFINPQLYPYLKLTAHVIDDSSRTPVQMDRWHVLYTPMPEAAVNPPLAYSFYNDTLLEGDRAKLSLAVQNISDFIFSDSLRVDYWLIDANRVRHDLPHKLHPPGFQPWSWFTDTVSVNTEGYPGLNELWMEVNRIGQAHSQPEQYHFNNIAMTRFFVGTDKVNPLLDVTFDGIHILNGDIVSAKPSILVTLKDENQFLALNDTSDFRLFLRRPSQTTPQLIPWSSETQFTPASLPNNSCKILFTPTLAEDGMHELIVQAKDRSSNQSGTNDYRIGFEVINKPSITNVLNYPNPFSTSTRFVFTLTGSEIPEIFKIQIMTVTGKVVREIEQDEIGPLHIGNNITQFAWDGRDQFGDQLANGLYLYRVVSRLNGNSIEHRETSADQYFKAQMGKMYLIR